MADILIGSQTTNALGVADFTALANGHYYLKMKTPPPGYDLDATELPFEITTLAPEYTTTVYDTPTIVASLVINKKDVITDDGVAGATVDFYRGNFPLGESDATDATGQVTIPNLMAMDPSVAYKVVENEVPSGYKRNYSEYPVNLPIAGTSQEVGNVPVGTGDAQVTVGDTYYHASLLQDAVYELYWTSV